MADADQLRQKGASPEPGPKAPGHGEHGAVPPPSGPQARMATPPAASPARKFTLLEDAERRVIIRVLKKAEGNKLRAARLLGIGRQTLYNKIAALDIRV